MKDIYVIDTETSTTSWNNGIPNGHIVEIGVAKVNLEKLIVIPFYSAIVKDDKASIDAWVFKNTDLRPNMVAQGRNPKDVAKIIGNLLEGCEVTSYNVEFDHCMIERDMPYINQKVTWGQDLMHQAAEVPDIPRRHGGSNSWPKAEDTYNHLCFSDPCGLGGKEKHRALDDAVMEGYILIQLALRGLYEPGKGYSP